MRPTSKRRSGFLVTRRRVRRLRPAVERCEPRALLDAAGFTLHLAPYCDTGTSPTDNITNVSRLTFTGNAAPNSVVTVMAIRQGSWPTQRIPLGQAIATSSSLDLTSNWTLNAPYLADGVYSIVASEVTPATSPPKSPGGGGAPAGTATLTPLVIDTLGPRVAHMAFDPSKGIIEAVISDSGSGVDPGGARTPPGTGAANPANYAIVPPGHIVGQSAPVSSPAPSVAGFYSRAVGETIVISTPSPWKPGRYLFQILSGGVTDIAGNPLDGEFSGRYPSGNGAPGGNFLVRLTVPRAPVVSGPKMAARLH